MQDDLSLSGVRGLGPRIHVMALGWSYILITLDDGTLSFKKLRFPTRTPSDLSVPPTHPSTISLQPPNSKHSREIVRVSLAVRYYHIIRMQSTIAGPPVQPKFLYPWVD